MNLPLNEWKGMQLKMHPMLLIELLGRDLYDDLASLIWELIRNALVACMADPDKWTPKSTKVETRVIKGHPLCRDSRALIVLDYGCGFTKNNIERFHELGNRLSRESAGSNAGASQKRLGRLALFPLSASYRGDVVDAPIFLFTRTTPTGNVTMVTLSAQSMSEGRIDAKSIKPSASELGPFVGIKGTFSMFVIPNTVVESNEELYDALKWRIPRNPSMNVNLTVNDVRVEPPALPKHAFNVGSGIMAYLDKNSDASSAEAGIWLCDAETGLRCSQATKLNTTHLPYPLNSPLLKGDIFIPGILRQQDTSRGNLSSSYLRSKAWKDTVDQLRLQLVSHATKLLGDADEFKPRDPVNKCWQDLIKTCNDAFGMPTRHVGTSDNPFGVSDEESEKIPPKPSSGTPTGSGTPGTRPTGTPKPGGTSGTNTRPKTRGHVVRIGEHDYLILMAPRPSDQDIFGTLSASEDGKDRQLHFNPDYEILKKLRGPAQREHMFMRFIELIANLEYSDNDLRRQRHASQLRAKVNPHNDR